MNGLTIYFFKDYLPMITMIYTQKLKNHHKISFNIRCVLLMIKKL